jgi:hypothetical protein
MNHKTYCLIKMGTSNLLWQNRCQNPKQHSCSVALPTRKLVVFAVSRFCDMQLYIMVYLFLCCCVRNFKFSACIMDEFPTIYYEASRILSAVTVDGPCTYGLQWQNAHILPLFQPTFCNSPPGTCRVYSRQ